MEFNLFRYWLDIGLDTEFSTKIQKNLDGLFCNEILQWRIPEYVTSKYTFLVYGLFWAKGHLEQADQKIL